MTKAMHFTQFAIFVQQGSPGQPIATATPIGGSLVFYIDVVGINDLYDQLKGKVEIAVDLRDVWYGRREFAFKDPDGYVLVYAEDVPKG